MKWQYAIITNSSINDYQEVFDEAGRNGWEYVGFVPSVYGYPGGERLIFKAVLPKKDKDE